MSALPRLNLITAPTVEPLVVADQKAHMRVTGTTDDTYITGRIKTARILCEQWQNRAYITQTWELTLDAFPETDEIVIPRPPLSSITSVKYTPDGGSETTFAAANYRVDTKSTPGRIVLHEDYDWPTDGLISVGGLVIRFVAGYGATAAAVPDTIINALQFLVAHWYEHREPVAEKVGERLPYGLEALLAVDSAKGFA